VPAALEGHELRPGHGLGEAAAVRVGHHGIPGAVQDLRRAAKPAEQLPDVVLADLPERLDVDLGRGSRPSTGCRPRWP
jgi:hypothetical protein